MERGGLPLLPLRIVNDLDQSEIRSESKLDRARDDHDVVEARGHHVVERSTGDRNAVDGGQQLVSGPGEAGAAACCQQDSGRRHTLSLLSAVSRRFRKFLSLIS